jgi:hypothetical protein
MHEVQYQALQVMHFQGLMSAPPLSQNFRCADGVQMFRHIIIFPEVCSTRLLQGYSAALRSASEELG